MLGLFVTNARASVELRHILSSFRCQLTACARRELMHLSLVLCAGMVCAFLNMGLMVAAIGGGITPSGNSSKITNIALLCCYAFFEYTFLAVVIWVTSQPKGTTRSGAVHGGSVLSLSELQGLLNHILTLNTSAPDFMTNVFSAVNNKLTPDANSTDAAHVALGPRYSDLARWLFFQHHNKEHSHQWDLNWMKHYVAVVVWLRSWALFVSRWEPEVLPNGYVNTADAGLLVAHQQSASDVCPLDGTLDTDSEPEPIPATVFRMQSFDKQELGATDDTVVTLLGLVIELQQVCRIHRELDQRVWQDMGQPLASYWILSSHNTEMSGHALTSNPSCKMIQFALMHGCRCLEIDSWDDANGKPVVSH